MDNTYTTSELIDLVNELRKENEELKECIVRIDEQRERQEKSYQDVAHQFVVDTKRVKSEVVKEFVKKFEREIKDVKFTLGQTFEIQSALRDVLKEMVGE
jgi:uncharacterized OsmC-like protein